MKIEPATNAIAKFNREIKASNKAFRKMSAPKRRVQIAKDVLAALRANQLRANTGSWIDFYGAYTNNGQSQVQSVLPEIADCNVCALGAVFACVALRKDRITVARASHTSLNGMEILKRYLRNEFSGAQLNLIEFAFEMGKGCTKSKRHMFRDGANQLSIKADEEKRANAWVNRAYGKCDEWRMKSIMRNIIRNSGSFLP